MSTKELLEVISNKYSSDGLHDSDKIGTVVDVRNFMRFFLTGFI